MWWRTPKPWAKISIQQSNQGVAFADPMQLSTANATPLISPATIPSTSPHSSLLRPTTVEPYLDMTNIYKFFQHKQGKKVSNETKRLSAIWEKVLGISFCKYVELQCSDWSHRPLTEEQIRYVATDAHCLLVIFKIFQAKVVKVRHSCNNVKELHQSNVSLGLKDILEIPDGDNKLVGTKFCNALDIVQATASSED
ncbi:hypothetical protein CRYUN_Cryun07bG0120000 [Craigia yunnanensis]